MKSRSKSLLVVVVAVAAVSLLAATAVRAGEFGRPEGAIILREPTVVLGAPVPSPPVPPKPKRAKKPQEERRVPLPKDAPVLVPSGEPSVARVEERFFGLGLLGAATRRVVVNGPASTYSLREGLAWRFETLSARPTPGAVVNARRLWLFGVPLPPIVTGNVSATYLVRPCLPPRPTAPCVGSAVRIW